MRRYFLSLLVGLALWAQTNVPVSNVPDFRLHGTSALSSCLMTVSGNQCAPMILRAPKTGNIRYVGIRTGTVTTSQSVDVRIETVSLTTGAPTGTLWAANTYGTIATPAGSTWYEVTLTADAAVTVGNLLAVVVAWTSFSGTPSVNISYGTFAQTFPYSATCTGATCTWVLQGNSSAGYLKYDDASIPAIDGVNPYQVTPSSINTGTTPDEAGIYFQLPYAARIIGASLRTTTVAGSDFDLILYDASDVVKASVSFDGDANSIGAGTFKAMFPTAFTISASTWYRLVLKPTTTANIQVVRHDYPSQAVADAWSKGANVYYTYRTDAGAWTNDQTKSMAISAVFDQITLTSGSGAAMPTVISQ